MTNRVVLAGPSLPGPPRERVHYLEKKNKYVVIEVT